MKQPPIGVDHIRNRIFSAEAFRKALSGFTNSTNNDAEFYSTLSNGSVSSGVRGQLCQCLAQLEPICFGNSESTSANANANNYLSYNSDLGRMLYTISILMMFSSVILLLMVRSIKRSRSTVEVETLLDAMRFREELDIQQRQKYRLQKAKKKVTAWLCRTNGKMWQSSPQIVLPPNLSARNSSMQSNGSYIPEIVISNSEELAQSANRTGIMRQNSYAPSLSLIFDFSMSRKGSQVFTDCSETVADSQISSAAELIIEHNPDPALRFLDSPKGRSASAMMSRSNHGSNLSLICGRPTT